MTARTSVAIRVYSLLLKAYPAEFRARYADQMVCFFEESWREVSALSNPLGALMLWLHTIDDLVSDCAVQTNVAVYCLHRHAKRDIARSQCRIPREHSLGSHLVGVPSAASSGRWMCCKALTVSNDQNCCRANSIAGFQELNLS